MTPRFHDYFIVFICICISVAAVGITINSAVAGDDSLDSRLQRCAQSCGKYKTWDLVAFTPPPSEYICMCVGESK